jgi:hypothetical protein
MLLLSAGVGGGIIANTFAEMMQIKFLITMVVITMVVIIT